MKVSEELETPRLVIIFFCLFAGAIAGTYFAYRFGTSYAFSTVPFIAAVCAAFLSGFLRHGSTVILLDSLFEGFAIALFVAAAVFSGEFSIGKESAVSFLRFGLYLFAYIMTALPAIEASVQRRVNVRPAGIYWLIFALSIAICLIAGIL